MTNPIPARESALIVTDYDNVVFPGNAENAMSAEDVAAIYAQYGTSSKSNGNKSTAGAEIDFDAETGVAFDAESGIGFNVNAFR